LKGKLQQHFDEACRGNKFMGAVSVSAGDTVVFSAACGLAELEWSTKNTVDTRFRIGSITKELTAGAVLLLHQEKKFSLDDSIGKHVPNLPAAWQSATIHQLLTHTSGVPIYTASPDYTRFNPELTRWEKLGAEPRELLQLVADRPLMYPHGSKFAYNNSGYILLGMLIEAASGVAYDRFVEERIFARLGMTDSGFDATGRIVPKRAAGYRVTPDGLRKAAFVDATTAWSAGGFYSTVADLTRWAQSLTRHTLLTADSTARMFAVYPNAVSRDPQGKAASYGYGVVLVERFDQPLHYHGGGISGFNSVLQHYPAAGLTLAVLSNQDSSEVTTWTLGDGLAKLWFAERP
jgi:D-alanyl-D-alanine carboxypeptidase